MVRKKVKDLLNFNLLFEVDVFVFELFILFKKKFFGDVNKVKKYFKWKYIWIYNGRIFIREDENKLFFLFDNVEDLYKFNLEYIN